MKTITIKIDAPFHLERVLKTHGWIQLPPFYWDDELEQLEWITHINGDISCLQIKQTAAQTISVSSAEDFDKAYVSQKIHHIFNLHLDLQPFYQLCATEPHLAALPELGMGRLLRCESLYEDVFKSICGTNIQWRQAVKIVHNLTQIGDEYKNTGKFCFPTPQQFLAQGDDFFREVGRVGYRSAYLTDLCQRFVDGEPIATQAEHGELSADALYKYFLGFNGIGKVTVNYLMALYGYFDRMSVDSLVIAYMREHHFNGAAPTPKQVEEHFAHFNEWKYLVYWMEFILAGGWNPDD